MTTTSAHYKNGLTSMTVSAIATITMGCVTFGSLAFIVGLTVPVALGFVALCAVCMCTGFVMGRWRGLYEAIATGWQPPTAEGSE